MPDITIDGRLVSVDDGVTIAAALMSEGVRSWRTTRVGDAPRGLFCGMGVCFDCLVVVNGEPNVRACVTIIEPGDAIGTQHGTGFDAGTGDDGGAR